MKKENLNLVLIIVVIMLPLISIFSISHITNNKIEELNTEFNEKMGETESDTDREVGTLVYLPFFSLSVMGSIVLFLIAGLTIIITFISLLMAILARAIIQNKKKKIAYRVLMTLVYIPYTLLGFLLLSFLFTHFSIIVLLYNAVTFTCLGINFYNTYSKKMFAIEENLTVEEQAETTEEIKEE